MKTKIIIAVTLLFSIIASFGQRPSIELTFTAIDSAAYVQLDSIKVMNRNQGGDTVLYYPDTILILDFPVGVHEVNMDDKGFRLFQNYPNPVADQTTVSLYVPERDKVSIMVTDILGRVIVKSERLLDKGRHTFRFIPGGGNLYFFTATWQGERSSIKILQTNPGSYNTGVLEYIGYESSSSELKATTDIRSFPFSLGDELLYIGYADTLQSGMLDSPEESGGYTFQFATNIPCPGTPTVEYEGQVYNTIQIFSQCWLKENLNVGTMIPGGENMANNDTIEKYCYNNEPDKCNQYGGLYQWDEMMQYTTQQGAQGICPPGWHLPADEEWKVLEGAVDSQYGIGDNTWHNIDYRGYDAGKNLKSTSGWYGNGNGIDLFGLSGLPGGRYRNGFYYVGKYSRWWTTSEYGIYAWSRGLYYDEPEVGRWFNNRAYGFSVRCLRDEVYINPIELTFTAIENDAWVQMDSIKVMNRTRDAETTIYGSDTTLALPIELLFESGDTLLYIGYSNTLQSGMLDSPEESGDYTFQFATNIPCPGTPTVDYGGQIYETIQVFSQCWLKENLNIGVMVEGTVNQLNNGTIEKYCYDNEGDNCTNYGGLYQWSEMMAYTTIEGSRGICPEGWHIPSDEDWKVLEGAVDSQFDIGDQTWNEFGDRGFDAGGNLKSTSGWNYNGNGDDLFGFTLLPAGVNGYNFYNITNIGYLWTSTRYSSSEQPYHRSVTFADSDISRVNTYGSGNGFSVRCVRD